MTKIIKDESGNRFITNGAYSLIVTASGYVEDHEVYYSMPHGVDTCKVFIKDLSDEIFKIEVDQPWSIIKWSRIEAKTRDIIKGLKP